MEPQHIGRIMAGCSRTTATAEQQAELHLLAASANRPEADRARAVLLSLERWTSFRIAAALCVKPDTVRQWRWLFGRDGVAGIRTRRAPGAAPLKAQAALAVVNEVLSGEVSDRPNWTLPRLAEEIARRTGVSISKSRLSVILRQKGASDGGAPATR
jgi:transposase